MLLIRHSGVSAESTVVVAGESWITDIGIAVGIVVGCRPFL